MPPSPELRAVRRGLQYKGVVGDEPFLIFDFKPSVGIAAAQIDKLGMDIRSFREPLKRVVQRVMAPSFRKNFEAEGRPDPWPEPSPATLDIREREGISGDLSLQRTGLLMKTIQQLNVWTITEKNATIQSLPSKISYGNIHQQGYGGSGTGKKMSSYVKKAGGDAKEAQKLLDDDLIMAMRSGKRGAGSGGKRTVNEIPQRQFVMIQEEDMEAIEQVFVLWLMERSVRAGFKPGRG